MKMYRKRYVPDEIIDISDDEVVYRDEKRLITKWKPIKPKDKIAFGESCVYFEYGWKVNKFYRKDGSFKFWYVDIINYEYIKEEDKYIFTDLLLDVIVHVDGRVEILDEDELNEAFEKGIITIEVMDEAKEKLNKLLDLINSGRFKELEF